MLRAVDVQQVLLQTTSVERIQQTQQQQSDLQQRYIAMHSIEEKKILKEKVKESDETEKARIQREEERERKRKLPGSSEGGAKAVADSRGGRTSGGGARGQDQYPGMMGR